MRIVLFLSLLFLIGISAKVAPEHSGATVQEFEGIKIFILSTPQSETMYLGTVKCPSIVWSGKPEELFKSLVKRTKKEYPSAQGLIINDVSFEKGDAIMFK